MASVVPLTRRNARNVLVCLAIGTTLYVLSFYVEKSVQKDSIDLRHSYDTILRGVVKSIVNTEHTTPALNDLADKNVSSTKVKKQTFRHTDIEDIPQTRSSKPEVPIADLKAIDMSEEFDCDLQCQNQIQEIRQSGVANACALSPMTQRRTRLWDVDGHLRADQIKRLNHLYPIKETKTIYCSVPKDGCSEWKRMILEVVGYNPEDYLINIHPYFDSKFQRLSNYSATEAEEILRTYKKFMFVREPFQRMISLFVDKALEQHKLPFDDTQFEQFLKFVSESSVTTDLEEDSFAEHWAPASILCLPCDIQYSFFGRLETSKRDTDYVFKNLFHVDKRWISRSKKISHNTDSKVKEHYTRQANVSMLRNLYKKFQLDYIMFTYSLPYLMKDGNQTNPIAH